MKKAIIYLLIVFAIQATQAQTTTVDSLREIDLETIVLTAQYAPQSEKNAIYKVDVIGKKDIQLKSANNLKELLTHELNIDLSQNSVFGSGIAIQGLSKENVKILLDGIPIIGRLNGIIDLTQIDLTNIEKIEVIEGPVSVFYGTDATAGTINLISKKNSTKKIGGGINAYYESIGAKKATAHLNFKHNKETLQIFGKIYRFGGLATLESVRNLNWEKRHQYAGSLNYTHHFDRLRLNYTGRLSQEKLFYLGEPIDTTNKAKDIDYFTKRIDNALNLSGNVFGNKYIDASLAYQYYLRNHQTYNVDLTTGDSQLSTKARDIDTSEFKLLFHRVQLGKDDQQAPFNYAIGYDFNIEKAAGKRIKDKEQSMYTLSLFSSINYKIGNIELQPGLRYTWNSAYNSLFTPAFNSKWTIGDNSILRFSYARGFRAPTIKELYLDFHIANFVITGNTDLKAEKSHSFNLYYSYYATIRNNQSLTIEPSLFYNEVSDLIALSAFALKRHYINVDNYKTIGGKLNISFAPNNNLSIKSGLSLTGRQNKFADVSETEPFLFSPEWNAAIRYSVEPLALSFGLYYKYTGKRDAYYEEKMTHAIRATTRDGYHNLDFSISKSFFDEMLNLSLGAKNIFDVKNIDILTDSGEAHDRDLYLWGRSFYGKLGFEF